MVDLKSIYSSIPSFSPHYLSSIPYAASSVQAEVHQQTWEMRTNFLFQLSLPSIHSELGSGRKPDVQGAEGHWGPVSGPFAARGKDLI